MQPLFIGSILKDCCLLIIKTKLVVWSVRWRPVQLQRLETRDQRQNTPLCRSLRRTGRGALVGQFSRFCARRLHISLKRLKPRPRKAST